MQLTIPILPAALILIAISLLVASEFVFYSILGEVNGRRKPEEQFSMFFVRSKVSEILRLHKQFYPDSPKRKLMWTTTAAGVILFVAVILANAHFVSQDQLEKIRKQP